MSATEAVIASRKRRAILVRFGIGLIAVLSIAFCVGAWLRSPDLISQVIGAIALPANLWVLYLVCRGCRRKGSRP